jgi:hypothetical protein
VFYGFGILCLVNFGLTIFLFFWKKWPLYVFCGIAIIVLIANIVLGLGGISILGLFGPVILYLIMRPKWELFK